ncbi:hypothetical protein [Polaribacter butkevichii]|uniref:C1q domain-containing protein n=1 Tax=Polaribacter butkevichii TaxID=218490 RepID=A0A2P6C863_9FLAO|nr:hypothetical protein [Polaribacter butkevichii]PQJ69119.1 hypothetical protein BTO14_13900 [Polaribacter butkevichii]
METSVLEKPLQSSNSFSLTAELREVTTNGIVNFNSKKEKFNDHSFWSGSKLVFPVYGVYKVSWGFHQDSINTFYKEHHTELVLIINNKIYEDKAAITSKTPCFHAVKSSHKTITFLFRENETLSLSAHAFNIDNPKIRDVYLKVEKLYVEENNEFGYES